MKVGTKDFQGFWKTQKPWGEGPMTTLTQQLIQAKAGLWKLFQHDVNQKQAMLRAAAAKGFGLPPESYGQPFPGETNLTVVSQTPDVAQPTPAPTKSGWLQTAILGGAILAAGSIPLVASLWPKQQPGVASPPVSPAPVANGSQAFDEVTEEKQPDGTWKETDRQPFGVFPKSKGPVP